MVDAGVGGRHPANDDRENSARPPACFCAPGTVFTGASLSGVTLTVTVRRLGTPPDVTV